MCPQNVTTKTTGVKLLLKQRISGQLTTKTRRRLKEGQIEKNLSRKAGKLMRMHLAQAYGLMAVWHASTGIYRPESKRLLEYVNEVLMKSQYTGNI